MNSTMAGLLISNIALLVTLAARIELRERRWARFESELTYMRRDLDRILRLYRLAPVGEQDKRRRR